MCRCNLENYVIFDVSATIATSFSFAPAMIPFRGFKDRNIDFSCTCSILDPNEVCDICFQAIHLINYEAYNICAEKVAKSIQAHRLPLHNYFQSMPFKPFFIWVMIEK